MTYSQAIEYIHSRPRFAGRPGLDRIKQILSCCGNPQKSMRFIHVAGTNGKGSVSAMLSEILRCAGFCTALYTSPYVTDFRERFRVNGEMPREEELARIIGRIKPIIDKMDAGGDFANEFEINTAAALLWFKEMRCEYAVLETGLGGRLDATNVIDAPDCAVITHIDLDHTGVLGDTVGQIAAEKCGIIKRGSRVTVYPEQYPEAESVIRAACAERGCELFIPQMKDVTDCRVGLDGCGFTYGGIEYKTPLVGAHQIKNAVTAVAAAESIGISADCIRRGVASARVPARQEVLSVSPAVILDGAHNPDGLRALAYTVGALLPDKPAAIIGMLADKDCESAVKHIAPCFSRIVTVAVNSPRTLSAEALAKIAEKYCPNVQIAENTDDALRDIFDRPIPNGLVACGSLYLAGEIRPKLIKRLG